MTNPEPKDSKKGHGLSVNELQGWAHNNLGRIWLAVVLVLATLSALTWWYNLSLIFLGLGLLLGSLQPDFVVALVTKGLAMLDGLKGTTRLIGWVVVAVLAVIFPFLLTLVAGGVAGAHLVIGHKLLELLRKKD